MSSKTNSDSYLPAPQPQKQDTSSTSEMLTPSQLASLRRATKEQLASGQKAFAHLRPNKGKKAA